MSLYFAYIFSIENNKNSMSLYFAYIFSIENNKNEKSVKFQGNMFNFCDFIQVYVCTTNHRLKYVTVFDIHRCVETSSKHKDL